MFDITQMLQDAGADRPGAQEELARALYDDLHAAASKQLLGERAAHTLQPTALVNEAWLRLFGTQPREFVNREHFFAAAATAIRRVLTDHSRKRSAQKRRGNRVPLQLEQIEAVLAVRDDQLLELDDALTRLAAFAPEQARLVELRFFAGLGMADIASILRVSDSTIERQWRLARAWLRNQLDHDGSDHAS